MAQLLITGGSSYLGQHLVPLAASMQETSYTYFSHDPLRSASVAARLDICDSTAVSALVQQLAPAIIIHTVGSNRSPDMGEVIVKGTRHITAAARQVGARLIHISTDVLFNGQDAPYSEEAPPSPIHAYGRAKEEAESIVAGHPDHVIVRTSLIYGLQIMDRGTAWIVRALGERQPVTLFNDQRRNPVWVQSLCLACLELATNSYQGILNVAGGQVLTRAEFGLRMLDWWGISDRQTLTCGPSNPESWPTDCTLDLSRARAVLRTPLPGVNAVLGGQEQTA